jgi:hypothetical protein
MKYGSLTLLETSGFVQVLLCLVCAFVHRYESCNFSRYCTILRGICSYELPSRLHSTLANTNTPPPYPKNIPPAVQFMVCLPIHTQFHRRPSVNMWLDIIGNLLTVPSVIEDRETVAYYLNF